MPKPPRDWPEPGKPAPPEPEEKRDPGLGMFALMFGGCLALAVAAWLVVIDEAGAGLLALALWLAGLTVATARIVRDHNRKLEALAKVAADQGALMIHVAAMIRAAATAREEVGRDRG